MDDTVQTSVPEGDRAELSRGSAELVEMVQRLEVRDQTSLEIAAQYRRDAKARLALIEERVGKRVSAVWAAWKGLRDLQNDLERPWKTVVAVCGAAIGGFELAQRKARAEAEAKARELRHAAEREAERLQREREAEAREAAERRRAERAAELLEVGDNEGAAREMTQPLRPFHVIQPILPRMTPPAAGMTDPPKVAGTSVVISYRTRMADLDALVVAAAADPTLRCLLQFNQRAADGMAEAMGERMKVPGVEVYEVSAVRQRK